MSPAAPPPSSLELVGTTLSLVSSGIHLSRIPPPPLL